jgi:hypothetical protein
MIMLQALPARFRAIQQLQAVRATHLPGSTRYRQVDYAIDLALSERRAVDDYLVRNLLRDAKRILERQAQSRRYFPALEDFPDEPEAYPDAPIDDIVLKDFATPEAILQARQLAEAIVEEGSHSSRYAARVMEGLLVGEPLADTASTAGISAERVKQLRAELRRAAGRLRSN